MGVVFYVLVFVFLVTVNYSGQSKQANGVQSKKDCHNGIGGSGGSGCTGGSGGSGGSDQCPTIDVLLKTCCKSGKNGRDGRDGRDGQNGEKGDKGEKGGRGPPGTSGKCKCSVKQQDVNDLQQKYDLMEQSFNAKIKELMKLKLNGTSTMGFFEHVRAIKGRAASLEAFKIKQMQFLVLTKKTSYPLIYKINRSMLHTHQKLRVYGANTIRHFQMNGEHFLAVAKRYYRGSYLQYSAIYKWHFQRFLFFQRFKTQGAGEITYFTIQDQNFLCVANSYDGNTYAVNSFIYKWDGKKFLHFQHLETEGAIACSAFSIDREHFVSLASVSPDSDSVIFKWSGKAFIKFQEIKTENALYVHHFNIQSLHFLAFIDATRFSYYSMVTILRWSDSKFVPFQTIKRMDAASLRSFEVNNSVFLIVTTSPSSKRGNGRVTIYKGEGKEFKSYQKLKFDKVSDLATFKHEGKTYFAVVSNSIFTDGQLYKWVSD